MASQYRRRYDLDKYHRRGCSTYVRGIRGNGGVGFSCHVVIEWRDLRRNGLQIPRQYDPRKQYLRRNVGSCNANGGCLLSIGNNTPLSNPDDGKQYLPHNVHKSNDFAANGNGSNGYNLNLEYKPTTNYGSRYFDLRPSECGHDGG